MPSVTVPLNTSSYLINNNTLCRGKVCGHKVEGIDCGEEVSEWLSLALGRPNLKLIRQSESTKSKRNFTFYYYSKLLKSFLLIANK